MNGIVDRLVSQRGWWVVVRMIGMCLVLHIISQSTAPSHSVLFSQGTKLIQKAITILHKIRNKVSKGQKIRLFYTTEWLVMFRNKLNIGMQKMSKYFYYLP